ncbi:Hypothetical protein R9X50_00119100 [Acrodontium crateriforme]|uniref:Uncharacterized protein n=1 Tax=Acrodontium crateriforme TaxID=150365 RepID=A0AAQ3LZT6_9PEZI|nr:Hypothetical protein R9X50_00119100 [Acrodontium crateriforme]
MPPIPLHIDAPITPKKPTAITPQTQGIIPANPPVSDVPSTTTIASSAQRAYPPARPGAVAGPAPTGSIPAPLPVPTRTTGGEGTDGPPAPRPGDVPVSPYTPLRGGGGSGLPPPPKADEARQPHPATQMSPPTQNYAPTHSTTTATTPSRPGPTTLNLGPAASPAAGALAPGTRELGW